MCSTLYVVWAVGGGGGERGHEYSRWEKQILKCGPEEPAEKAVSKSREPRAAGRRKTSTERWEGGHTPCY